MKSPISPRKRLLVFAAAVLMSGCGGGGGGAGGDDGGVIGGGGDTGGEGGAGTGACAVSPQNCVAGERGTLVGHVISTTDFHGATPDHTTVVGPHITIVGDGIELMNGFEGFATIDLSGASIRITAATDQPFGYFELIRFADANGTISPIAAVTVDPATNYGAFNASRLAFTADSIDVNLTGLSGQQGQQILLNITFAAP
jgi:hypothetical protein